MPRTQVLTHYMIASDCLTPLHLRHGLYLHLYLRLRIPPMQTNDPKCCCLKSLCVSLGRARRNGYKGHVVLGHATSLALQDEATRTIVIAQLAALGPNLSVVCNPCALAPSLRNLAVACEFAPSRTSKPLLPSSAPILFPPNACQIRILG